MNMNFYKFERKMMNEEVLIPEKESVASIEESIQKPKSLVIYNDDVNTFEYVIESLIKVCDHQPIQAEQCTWLIHHKGKCAVKNGDFPKLKPMKEALTDRGISAQIEG